MKVLKTEPDEFILNTIDFMNKVDKRTRDKIFSYAQFSYSEYQEELEKKQNINQNIQIVKTGGVL